MHINFSFLFSEPFVKLGVKTFQLVSMNHTDSEHSSDRSNENLDLFAA